MRYFRVQVLKETVKSIVNKVYVYLSACVLLSLLHEFSFKIMFYKDDLKPQPLNGIAITFFILISRVCARERATIYVYISK